MVLQKYKTKSGNNLFLFFVNQKEIETLILVFVVAEPKPKQKI